VEYDFIVKYKKGTNMPADYLSRLPSPQVNAQADMVAALGPFQPNKFKRSTKSRPGSTWHFQLFEH